jgi:type II secretory pathway component GspD/PulD (secretin)
MMQKQKTNSISKVPLLGDMPLIGFAFRHTVRSDTKTELLIFLTPYIVEGTETLKDLSERETERTDLPQTAFQGDDVRRYLDNLHIHSDNPSNPSSAREIRRAKPVMGNDSYPPLPSGD